MTQDDGWSRLDPRMLAVAPAQEIVKFVPVLIIALFAGGDRNRHWWVLTALVGVVIIGVLRWVTTRYRVTAERIELRSGLLFRQHRSVPRDRVRTVDVTAKVLHRVFGLSVLRVGTGQHEPGRDGELTLDAVSSAESERLRATLLDRSPIDGTDAAVASGPAGAAGFTGGTDAPAAPGTGGPAVGGAGVAGAPGATWASWNAGSAGVTGAAGTGAAGAGTAGTGTAEVGFAGNRTVGAAGVRTVGGRTTGGGDGRAVGGGWGGGQGAGGAWVDPGERGAVGLSALEWSWLRFAPLTVLGVASIGALLGGVWQVLGELNVDLEDSGAARSALDWLTGRPVAAAVVSVTAAVLVAGSLGAVALYVEAWWGYRLTRRRDGTLRVNRGLLTKRSVSLEERRLRGVEVTEPLLLRAGRGARCTAVATGSGSGDRASLLPPAPRAEAHRVAAAVLHPEAWWQHHLETGDGTGGGGVSPTEAVLERHPGAALRRRLARAVVPAVVVVAVLGYGDGWGALPSWPWVVAAVVLVPVSVLLGLDRYRNLGHLVTDEHLIVRSGSLVRRTVALRRTGIIGWQVSQSVFQRQAGLATATAVTAAGAGAYDILDVDLDRAMDLGERLAVRQQTT